MYQNSAQIQIVFLDMMMSATLRKEICRVYLRHCVIDSYLNDL